MHSGRRFIHGSASRLQKNSQPPAHIPLTPVHPPPPQAFLKDCLVGFVAGGVPKPPAPPGLPDHTEYRDFKITQIEQVSPDTKMLRFELPSGVCLPAPVGSHVIVRPLDDDQKEVPGEREYTIVTPLGAEGYFEIIVKLYHEGRHTTHIHSRRVGDSLQVKGPVSRYQHDPKRTKIGMLSVGTGVAPMLQVLRSLPIGCEASLLSGNRHEEDILFRQELEENERDGIAVRHVLSQPGPGWDGLKGYVTPELISQFLPPPDVTSRILVCGSIPFNKGMQDALKEMGYDVSQVFTF